MANTSSVMNSPDQEQKHALEATYSAGGPSTEIWEASSGRYKAHARSVTPTPKANAHVWDRMNKGIQRFNEVKKMRENPDKYNMYSNLDAKTG